MYDIVMKCSHFLDDCYTPKDMDEIKGGQLKITEKIFFDVLRMTNKAELKKYQGKRKCETLAKLGYLQSNTSDSPKFQAPMSFLIIVIFWIKF